MIDFICDVVENVVVFVFICVKLIGNFIVVVVKKEEIGWFYDYFVKMIMDFFLSDCLLLFFLKKIYINIILY